MSKLLAKKLIVLVALLAALCLALGAGFAFAGGTKLASADEGENASQDRVLFSEDFSDALDGALADKISVANGEGTVTSNTMFDLPLAETAPSNNYSVEFDLKLTGTSEFYVHFVGLDGTNKDNIYLCVIAQGTYLRVTDNYGHDIYNNTGDLHGGLDATPVTLEEFAHFRFVHFEGYVELWVNGTRRCVSHLCDFGNNNYMSRSPIEEGTITSIALHAQNAGAVVLDNLLVTEPTGLATSYRETSADTSVSSAKTFPLSAENLYLPNFYVESTFRIADDTAQGYYPSIKLYGMNASLRSNNQKEYAVNVQAFVNGTTFLPQIMWQPEDPATAWRDVTGQQITVAAGQDVTLRVEVYGDHIALYVNGALSASSTFTEMGLEEGRLQYLRVQSGGGGAYWTQFAYAGFETESAVEVTASGTYVLAGEDVTFRADLFGTRGDGYAWYVNGEKQTETGLTFTAEALAAGTYRVQYKNAAEASNEVVVTVVDKMVTITSDKTEIYPTESITATAQMQGDFAGETFAWYLNGEKQAETGDTITLSGLSAGRYELVYKSDATESNVFAFTVLEAAVEVTTEKNSYFLDETATFTAETEGVPETDTIAWYVDGVLQEGAAGNTFSLAMSGYEAGTKIVITAQTSSGVVSNEVTVSVAFDVMQSIRDNEYFKTIYEDVLEEGGTYGNFSAGKEENGNVYLYSTVENASTYYTLNATMPSNVNYLFEYKLYIPDDIAIKCYVYPCLAGLNSKYPAGMVEIAWEVNDEGVRPYVKDQNTNTEYLHTDYGFGVDLSYEGGLAKKGDWNQISVAVSGQYVSMYLNGQIVLFFEMAGATVPSGCSFNLFPDGGTGVVPVRIKDISFSGVVEPASDLQSVTVSLSTVRVEAGGDVIATATLNPFNAEANAIAWFVNGEKVEGASSLSYTFSSETPGEYSIVCEIDGVRSAAKTVTVTEAGGGTSGGGTQGDNTGLWVGVGIGIAVVVIAAVVVTVLVIRKKKNNGKQE